MDNDNRWLEEVQRRLKRADDALAAMGGNGADGGPLAAPQSDTRPEPPRVGVLIEGSMVDDFADWPDGRIDNYFEAEPPALQWFCEQRLLAGRGHALAGVGGSSKTRGLYHLAVGAVTGHLPWEWQVATTGSAALFLTEDVAAQVHRVLHAMGRHLNPNERAMLRERLRVFPLAGMRARLLELDGDALRLSDAYGWFMRQVAALSHPVAFIGIDPALGVSEGDELSQAHQRRLGELVDHIAIRTGACAMLSAHATKGSLNVEEVASHTSRGAGAITDALRGEYVLRNMTADEARRYGITDAVERKRHLQLIGTKGNELPPEAYVPLWLRRGELGMLGQVVLQESAAVAAVGPRELLALEVLEAASKDGDSTMKFWSAQCAAAGIISTHSEGAQEKAMQRLRDTLLKAGYVKPGHVRGTWVSTRADM